MKDNKIRIPLSLYISDEFIENLKTKLDSINTLSEIPYQNESIPYTRSVVLFDQKKNKKYRYNIKSTVSGLIELKENFCQNKDPISNYGASNSIGKVSICGYNQYEFLLNKKNF